MNRPAPPWLAIRSAIASISAVRAGAISTIAPSGASAASGGSKAGSSEPAPADEAQLAAVVEADGALAPAACRS